MRVFLIIFVILMTLAECNFHESREIPVTLSGEPVKGATIELYMGTLPNVKRQTYETSEKGTVIITRPASTTVFNGGIIAPDHVKQDAADLVTSWIATETTSPLTLLDLEKVRLRFIRSLPIELESAAASTTLRWNHPEGFTSTVHLMAHVSVYEGVEEVLSEDLFTIRCIMKDMKSETFNAPGVTTIMHKKYPGHDIIVTVVQKNSQDNVVRVAIQKVVIPPHQ